MNFFNTLKKYLPYEVLFPTTVIAFSFVAHYFLKPKSLAPVIPQIADVYIQKFSNKYPSLSSEFLINLNALELKINAANDATDSLYANFMQNNDQIKLVFEISNGANNATHTYFSFTDTGGLNSEVYNYNQMKQDYISGLATQFQLDFPTTGGQTKYNRMSIHDAKRYIKVLKNNGINALQLKLGFLEQSVKDSFNISQVEEDFIVANHNRLTYIIIPINSLGNPMPHLASEYIKPCPNDCGNYHY